MAHLSTNLSLSHAKISANNKDLLHVADGKLVKQCLVLLWGLLVVCIRCLLIFRSFIFPIVILSSGLVNCASSLLRRIE